MYSNRFCFVSRKCQSRYAMIRFVIGYGEFILPDIEEKLPGRGMWIFADREMISCAIEKKLFAWAAKKPVKVDSNLLNMVESSLKRLCLKTLSLAKRLGLTITSYPKIRDIIEAGAPGLLLEAMDGTECARRPLRAIVASHSLVSCLTKADITETFGRKHVLYTFVQSTPSVNCLANKLLRDTMRLEGVRLKKSK
ncbi:DUF448 domain-containing protein [Candidatus Endolissoclinum faulkneri]|nr:DUF448 domain-containing protein [Candidatus Endolissoclinum faulkneri]